MFGAQQTGGNAYEKKEHDHALDRHVFGGGSASGLSQSDAGNENADASVARVGGLYRLSSDEHPVRHLAAQFPPERHGLHRLPPLPNDGFVNKWMAKARDGMRHSTAMTLRNYGMNLHVTDDAAGRIQANCIRCHESAVSQMLDNSALYAKQRDDTVQTGRRCWECHRSVPHGRMRNLAATQNNFLEQDIK